MGTASTGPRPPERAKNKFCDRAIGDELASTGPRSHERGKLRGGEIDRGVGLRASTGPRSHERGKAFWAWTKGAKPALLQRGRALTSAESEIIEALNAWEDLASTGPRSHERGKTGTP